MGRAGVPSRPDGFHTLDLATFKARYPQLRVVAPDGSRGRIGRFVPVEGIDALPATDRLRAFVLEGTRGDAAVQVGRTLCLPGDIFFNVERAEGIDGLVFRLLGSVGGPRVTPIARLFLVRHRGARRRQLERLAQSDVERLVPCHGEIVYRDASQVLRGVAQSLT